MYFIIERGNLLLKFFILTFRGKYIFFFYIEYLEGFRIIILSCWNVCYFFIWGFSKCFREESKKEYF